MYLTSAVRKVGVKQACTGMRQIYTLVQYEVGEKNATFV